MTPSCHTLVFTPNAYYMDETTKIRHAPYDITDSPIVSLQQDDTQNFVMNYIGRNAVKYEVSSANESHLFQLVFDNFELRTLLYFMMTIPISTCTTHLTIKNGSELVMQKCAPFKTDFHVDFGKYLASVAFYLTLMFKKDLENIQYLRNAVIDMNYVDGEHIFTFKTTLPASYDLEKVRSRFQSMLSHIILPTFTITTR